MVRAGQRGDIAAVGDQRQPGALGARYSSCGLGDDLSQDAGFEYTAYGLGAGKLNLMKAPPPNTCQTSIAKHLFLQEFEVLGVTLVVAAPFRELTGNLAKRRALKPGGLTGDFAVR